MQRLFKTQPSQKEIQSPSRQPIIPASQRTRNLTHRCQSTLPAPPSAPTGQNQTDQRQRLQKGHQHHPINEYTVDWVIKCSSNACIMACQMDEAGILQTLCYSVKPSLSDSLPIMTTWRLHHSLFLPTGTELARTRPGAFFKYSRE